MRPIVIIIKFDMDDPSGEIEYSLTGVRGASIKDLIAMTVASLDTVSLNLRGVPREAMGLATSTLQ